MRRWTQIRRPWCEVPPHFPPTPWYRLSMTVLPLLLFWASTHPAMVTTDPFVLHRAQEIRKAGHPDVADVMVVADPRYHRAIADALVVFDPTNLHPEWELELWRICKREAWCGAYGEVGVHEGDGHHGKSAYEAAVRRGKLDPEKCPDHRITEERPYKSFSTNGGFGMIFAYHGWRLGPCVGPEAFQKPRYAAYAATHAIANCERWEMNLPPMLPGQHKRTCTCEEHLVMWVGAGRWRERAWDRKLTSLQRQCGPDAVPSDPRPEPPEEPEAS